MKTLILDFGDSFTYNILNEFSLLDIKCDVKLISEFNREELLSYELIVLGPGPGIVSDYKSYHPLISSIIDNALLGNLKVLGICLGHQLIHNHFDRDIVQIKNPVHGQSIPVSFSNHPILNLSLKDNKFEVQLYNSWIVERGEDLSIFEYELCTEENHLLASFSENITSYQFHPESIGTSCPRAFLLQVLV